MKRTPPVFTPSRRSPGVALLPHPLAAAIGAALLSFGTPGLAQLPVGPNVVSGSASIATSGNTMTVTNSPNAILNWQGFSIGAQQGVFFRQQDAASQVLNRVVGNDPSQILGSLGSNGRVWLLNPHGVLFGPNARVDVAGLVAGTLDIGNADFLAGRFAFTRPDGLPAGQVINQGELRSSFGGRVWLIGDVVRNEGLIAAPGGHIVLAAGQSVELLDSGLPNVLIRVSAPDNEALNLGSLLAGSGGSIDVHGGIVNQQGIIRADSVGSDAAGRVTLRAQTDLKLGDASQTSASAAGSGAGGLVEARSTGGTTLLSGRVDATSAGGHGGRIHLLGQQVGIYGQAVADASGATGGGEVLVGGDYQGGNPAIANAQVSYLGRTASLKASATQAGDGGRVIVWADNATRAYGRIEARGGALGGNGGFVETSGAYLDARPLALDVGAPKGLAGTWLLDPNNVFIRASGSDSNIDSQNFPILTTTNDDAVIDSTTLASQLGSGLHIVVRTGAAGANSQAGDITVEDSILIPSDIPGSLTLQAHRNIIVNPGVRIESSLPGVPVSITFTADFDGNNTGYIALGSGSTIITQGGDIILGGGGTNGLAFADPASSLRAGIHLNGALLDAGSGSVHLTGRGNGPDTSGVVIANSSIAAATIDLDGIGGHAIVNPDNTLSHRSGVAILNGSVLTAQNMLLSGQQDANSAGWWGLEISGGSRIAIPAPAVGNLLLSADVMSLDNAEIAPNAGSTVTLSADNAVFVSAGSRIGGTSFTGNINILAGSSVFITDSTVDTAGALDIIPSRSGGTFDVLLSNLSFGTSPRISGISIGNSAADTLLIREGTNLDAPAPINASAASKVVFTGSPTPATLSSTATGDAILISAGALDNQTGATALSAPNGRWLVMLSAAPASSNLNGLPYDFVQFDAVDTFPAQSNNGVLFDTPLNLQGRITREYDGTTVAPVSAATLQSVSGLPSGYTMTISSPADGAFLDKVVGQTKPITFSLSPPIETLSDSLGKPVYGQSVSYVGDITPKALSLGVLSAASKVYDGNTTASLTGVTLNGVVLSDDVSLAGSTASFADRNVGTAKPVTVSGGSLAGLDAGNYSLASSSGTTSADITPRALSLAAFTAASKTYDGTAAATITGSTLSGVIGSDSVSLAGATASFADPNVGSGKAVTLAGGSLAGTDAGNYSLLAGGLSPALADITPATLTYTADAALRITGEPIGVLTGQVLGFKASDTLASATSGTPAWTTPVSDTSVPGNYPVNGSGLTAGNYIFTQAAANASALSISVPDAPGNPPQLAQSASTSAVSTATTLATLNMAQLGGGSTADASSIGGAGSFGSINLEAMTQDGLSRLLESRRDFKRKLFADAIYKLELDPSLADVRPCASAAAAASGLCRVTEAQRNELQTAALQASRPKRRLKIAQLPGIERKIAVLIGINDYASKDIPPLESAIPDADAVAAQLVERMGYEARVIRNPTKAGILAALNQLVSETGDTDSVIIYYAGHGLSLDKTGEGYWIPSDGTIDDPGRWVSNRDITEYLKSVRARQIVMISDSCYSGAFTREAQVKIAAELKPDEVLHKRSVVVLSSGGDEPVADEGRDGHSIFAWHLMETLRKVQNWEAGNAVFNEVLRKVSRTFPQKPQYGAMPSAGHQQGGDYLFEFRQFENGGQ